MYKRTSMAVVVCCLLILPASLVGGIFDVGYRLVLDHFNWSVDRLDAVASQALAWFVINGVPDLVHGAISSAIAMLVVSRIFPLMNAFHVCIATGGFYSALFIVLLLLKGAITEATIEAAAQLVGLWLGLILCVQSSEYGRADAA